MNEVPPALVELFAFSSDCLVFFKVQSLRHLVVEAINPAAARTFQLDSASTVGLPLTALFPADLADALLRSFQLCFDSGSPTTAEHCCILPSGSRWFSASLVPVRREGQMPHRLIVTWRDITAQKTFEQLLCDREEMFRRLVETTSVIPWEIDFQSGCFTYVGPQAIRRFGYPEADWYRPGFLEQVLHPQDRATAVNAFTGLTRGSDEYAFEFRMISHSGEVVWVHDLVSVVYQSGRVLLRGFLVDVTARRHAEEEVRQLNDKLEARVLERTHQLEAANRELEAFCYSVSHDLRAPLRAIDGFAKALAEDYHDRLDADGRDMLRRVRSASQRMGELIDDLLTLSRVSRGEMRQTNVCLSSLAHNIAAGLQQTAPQRRIVWQIEPDLCAQGDAALLRVLLENLLGNAWKYTSRHASARIEFGRSMDAGQSTFFVRDDGAGFDPTYANKLFQPFQRLHRPDEFDGHGIGLATVQRIVRKHGGQTWAEGQVEKGATVYFTLSGS